MKEEKKLTPKLRFPEFREAEGWESRQLVDVCSKITQGGTPDTSKPEYWGGAINWMTPAEMGKTESPFIAATNRTITEQGLRDCSSDLLPVNSVILSVRAPIGHLAINTAPMAINQGCKGLIAGKSLDFYFLYCSLVGSKTRLIDLGAGNTFKELSGTALKRFEIPIPSPAEQQKIAECLSSVDELIAAQARKLDALKTHKKGLMQQLFPREDETQPRLRFPEFQDAGEWVEDRLIDIATFRRGSFPQPYGLPEWYDEDGGMPFIQVFDVGQNFRLKDKTKSKISKLGAEKSVFIPKGTLIVTLQGSIGRVAITHYDAYIDRTLLIFETFRKPIEVGFFARLIQNLFDVEKEIAPGGIIKTITKEALSDFKVKLPSIEEQQRIADCLTSLDDLIAAQTQKLDALKIHKKGLMQQLFSSPQVVEA
jgi:type I restriction enzyme S subunit